jgi:hypothetical protein
LFEGLASPDLPKLVNRRPALTHRLSVDSDGMFAGVIVELMDMMIVD